jgi:hypothetical protein
MEGPDIVEAFLEHLRAAQGKFLIEIASLERTIQSVIAQREMERPNCSLRLATPA